MTREEKSVAINEILDVLKSNQNIYLTDISGLNALETSNLRRMCFKAGVKLSVVKNTLLEKAMENSDKDFGDLKESLKGNTSVMIAEVSSAPAKVIKNFRKKSERPILKGAMIEEDIYVGDDQLEILFAIKSKEELIGGSRRRPLVTARQVAMYIFRELTDLSYPSIAREFGGRDHTTVMHAVKKVDELRDHDSIFAEDVELLRRMLES